MHRWTFDRESSNSRLALSSTYFSAKLIVVSKRSSSSSSSLFFVCLLFFVRFFYELAAGSEMYGAANLLRSSIRYASLHKTDFFTFQSSQGSRALINKISIFWNWICVYVFFVFSTFIRFFLISELFTLFKITICI